MRGSSSGRRAGARVTLAIAAMLAWLAAGLVEAPALPAGATVLAPWSWIAMYLETGGGVATSQLTQQSTTTPIVADGTPSGVSVAVNVLDSTAPSVGFAPPTGQTLAVGSYTEATLQSDATHPSLGVTDPGCLEAGPGSFVIDDIAFTGGVVTRLAATFVQRCQADIELFGQVEFNEPPTSPLVAQASNLVLPANYVGVANAGAALSLTNSGAAPVAVGPVSVHGAGAGDVAISNDTCPATLGPGQTCQITATVTPLAVGTRQSVIQVASGSSAWTVAVTDTGMGGNAAFVLDSATGDPLGEGELWNFDQFNSVVQGSGTPAGVDIVAYYRSEEQFEVGLDAPSGMTLSPGTYPFDTANQGTPWVNIERYTDWEHLPPCNDFAGTLTIQQLAFDSLGELVHLSADVEGSCTVGGPNLYLSMRLASPIGFSAVGIQPAPYWNPDPLSFSQQVVGRASGAQVVTLTNAGSLPLTIEPSITGTDSGDFGVATGCDAGPLAPASSCTASVTFTPTATGERDATLTITDGTPRGVHTIALVGTGDPAPTITYPVDNGCDTDTNQPFTWTTTPAAQANRLTITIMGGSSPVVDSGVLAGTQTSYPVPALPAHVGMSATVSTEVGGAWSLQATVDFCVQAHVAALISLSAYSSNATTTQAFTWTTNPQDQAYDLVVGTAPGSANLINSGVLPASQGTYTPPPLPAGVELFATLFTEWYGSWSNYESTVFVLSSSFATFTNPIQGAHLTKLTGLITWSAPPRAQGYWLVVGTAPGKANVVNSGPLPPGRTYWSETGLPSGSTLYAVLFTEVGGAWSQYQAITFTTARAGATG